MSNWIFLGKLQQTVSLSLVWCQMPPNLHLHTRTLRHSKRLQTRQVQLCLYGYISYLSKHFFIFFNVFGNYTCIILLVNKLEFRMRYLLTFRIVYDYFVFIKLLRTKMKIDIIISLCYIGFQSEIFDLSDHFPWQNNGLKMIHLSCLWLHAW